MFRSVFVIALLACLVLAAMPVLATTWDLSTDWAAINTTGGAWTIGDANLNWGPGNGIWQYNTLNAVSPAPWWAGTQHWDMNNDYVLGMAIKNTSGAVKTGISGADYEVNQVAVFQGQTNVWGTQFHASVIRWTAPEDMAAISISGSFAQIYNGNDTVNIDAKLYDPTSQVDSLLFSDTIQGYRGNASTGFSGAIGTHNTTAISGLTLNNILAGQVIDFRVYEPTTAGSTATNQTAVSLTINTVDVPEPGSMLALGSGLVGLVGFAIRRRRA